MDTECIGCGEPALVGHDTCGAPECVAFALAEVGRDAFESYEGYDEGEDC